MVHRRIQGIVVLAFLLGITACSASDIPLIRDVILRNPAPATIPGRDEVVRGDTDPAIVTLDLKTALRERRLSATEELPSDIIIPTTNLDGVPITSALQAVLSGTDVSLSWSASGALGSRLVTVMNLRGPLPSVVEKICSAARVFCSYRHGSIELSEKETFIITLPPIMRIVSSSSVTGSSSSAAASSTSATNSIVEAIDKLLGPEKATKDDQGGTIVYTATVDIEERISKYLEELRSERPLIVLQFYIWEVTLNRDSAQGINWTTFTSTLKEPYLSLTNNLNSLATTTGSVSLGAVTTGTISASAIASFIATKGRVQTISNPQVTFVSGSGASLKVGGTQKYISQVGSSSSNTSGTSSTTSSNTISTEEIETGLALNVVGSYENGVVFANLDLSLRTLIALNPTTSGGLTIDLPETTDEKINTMLRVRPGDSLVLAGLVTSADNGTSQGFPIGSDRAIPLYGSDEKQNRELVIIVKPSIVRFANESGKRNEAKEKLEKKNDVHNSLSEPTALDDRDTKPIDLLKTRAQPVVKEPPFSEAVPAVSSPSKPIPFKSDDSLMRELSAAPVDNVSGDDQSAKSGFAHAFDRLFQSSRSSASGGGEP